MPHNPLEPIDTARRFQLLVEAVTDYGIYLVDIYGRVTSWNTGAQRIKGYKSGEIIGEHFSRFFTPEDQAAGVPERALETARTTGRFEGEGWRVRKDGSRFWAMAVLDAVHDENGQLIGYAKITRDMTERRLAQEALDEAREQLLQSQKLEAIGQLTGGIAHDFNNLLTVILGSVSLAERHAGDPRRVAKLLAAIRQAAERGEELTKHLLAFGRRQPTESETIDTARRLRETANMLNRTLRGDIELTTKVPPDLWPVDVDPSQFELALLNVGLNARDAMPNGGTLQIVAENVTLRRQGTLNGNHVAIRLIDTGSGIPPEVVNRVFEPFFTTKPVGKGSGLGLAQAYGFARQSGGTVEIHSTVGAGTTVTFYLPASERPVTAGKEPAADPMVAKGKATILLVEDDPDVAELALSMLEDGGFSVRVAHGARAALNILRSGEPVDLVFSDIVMPGGMTGVDLAQVVRKEFPAVPILLSTGFSTAAATATADRFPMISKPYRGQELLERVAGLVRA